MLTSTTIFLTTLLAKDGASALPDNEKAAAKRLRTHAVHKSKASSARVVDIASGNNAAAEKDIRGQRKLMSIPFVSFSFSINLPGVTAGNGTVTVKPIETDDDEDVPVLGSTCSFCHGLVMDSSAVIPASNGTTCGVAASFAATIEGSSAECAEVKQAEFLCCQPTLERSCDFCSSGITVGDDFVIPDGDGVTCGVAARYAASLEGDTALCAEVQFGEMVCCPTAPTVTCEYCTSGVTAADDFVFPNSNGFTCDQAVSYAGMLEGTTEACTELQLGEYMCCPSTPDVPCDFCKAEGVTAPDDVLISEGDDGFTCDVAASYAEALDGTAELCPQLQQMEAICCPTAPDVPCDFCKAEGVTAGDDALISEEGDGFTCGQATFYAGTLEGTAEQCSMVQGAELFCCPTAPKTSCDFCKSGVTAGDDFVIPESEGATCGQAVIFTTTLDGASDSCAEVQQAELLCCPALLESTCDFCKSGVTAGDDFVIPLANGLTCGLAAEYAGKVEDSAKDCSNLQEAEYACCPIEPEVPCDFCKSGITAGDDIILPGADGATCGMAALYAASIEGTASECVDTQLAQFICCPAEALPDEGLGMEMSMSMASAPTESPVLKSPIAPTSPVSSTGRPTPAPEASTEKSAPSSAMMLGTSLFFTVLSVAVVRL